jgi:hypothetical protein
MIVKRLYKQTLFILIPVAALSAFIEPKKLPLSILIGGVLALLNLKGLARGLESLLGTYRPTGKLVMLSMVRLFLLFAVIVVLAVYKLVNLLGLMAGFTVVFLLLIKEGLKVAKES